MSCAFDTPHKQSGAAAAVCAGAWNKPILAAARRRAFCRRACTPVLAQGKKFGNDAAAKRAVPFKRTNNQRQGAKNCFAHIPSFNCPGFGRSQFAVILRQASFFAQGQNRRAQAPEQKPAFLVWRQAEALPSLTAGQAHETIEIRLNNFGSPEAYEPDL